MKQAVEVTILGRQYTVKSSTGPAEVQRVAEYVNRQLAQTAAVAPTADTLHITVLTLLNIAGMLLQAQGGGIDAGPESERLAALLQRLDQALGE